MVPLEESFLRNVATHRGVSRFLLLVATYCSLVNEIRVINTTCQNHPVHPIPVPSHMYVACFPTRNLSVHQPCAPVPATLTLCFVAI